MKLSTKGRYGLRAMVDLAETDGSGPVLMGDIAKRQEISRKYLHSLLTSLKEAGLVRSVRGARGGYLLAKPMSEIMINDIFEALEGKLSIIDCATDRSVCSRVDGCYTWGLWKKLNDAMVDVLSDVTLTDLVGDNRQFGTKVNRDEPCAVSLKSKQKKKKPPKTKER
ncbi:MAG: Rrf2 family transcriptional regulator [Proteobacteria bacterium]|nr:Rrf2 family transcriptional regulator [Pseudomonadota bacterium]